MSFFKIEFDSDMASSKEVRKFIEQISIVKSYREITETEFIKEVE